MKLRLFFLSAFSALAGTLSGLSAPVNTSPANGSTNLDPFSPCYISPTSRQQYDSVVFEFDITTNFNSQKRIRSKRIPATASFSRISGLSFGTTYYWRTKGFNGSDSSPWSSVWSFTTTNGSYVHNATNKICMTALPAMPGEFYECQVDYTPQFNSPRLKTQIIEKHCGVPCKTYFYKYYGDTIYTRMRSVQTTETGPWSNIVKEFVPLVLKPSNIYTEAGDEFVYNLVTSDLLPCSGDSAYYYVYQDTSISFNSPALKVIRSNTPYFGNVKLFPFSKNHFKARYVVKGLMLDTTYPLITTVNGPDGTLKVSFSDLQAATVYVPRNSVKVDIEYDTMFDFSSGSKTAFTSNTKGKKDFSLRFWPVISFIRLYGRYRLTTDSMVYPWRMLRNERLLTPTIETYLKVNDTTPDLMPGFSTSSLETSVYYYFEMDRKPDFSSANKRTAKIDNIIFTKHWFPDTLKFTDTIYLRTYIKTTGSHTDWSTVYRYIPNPRIQLKPLSNKLFSPYKIILTNIPRGSRKIEIEVYKDTLKSPISRPAYCTSGLDVLVSEFSANPGINHVGKTFLRVRYTNTKGNVSKWSDFKQVEYMNGIGLPIHLSPGDCSAGPAGSVKLVWSKVPNTTAYMVEYTNNPGLIKAQRIAWTVDTFVHVFLEKNSNYSWTVTALDSSKTSRKSPKTFNYMTEKTVMSRADGPVLNLLNEIRLFPNPALQDVTVICSNKMNAIQVYDLNGALVTEVKCDTDEYKLNIALLNSGVYFIKVITLQGGQYARLIKI